MESFTNLEKIQNMRDRQHYRLDRMRYLLRIFDDPHLILPTIHVAGTKGKGSTATMIASVLSQSGHTVGLYTSPHVQSYSERITIDSGPVDPDLLLGAARRIREEVESIPPGTLPVDETPTTFELLTLLAFILFRDAGCSVVVAEVGIGGRLDCTNVVQPIACAITPIEIEHADVLGDTIEEIAAEKAGIIKPGTPVFSAAQTLSVRHVIEGAAARQAAPLTFVDRAVEIGSATVTTGGTSFDLADGEGRVHYELRLAGTFQAENAALAHVLLTRTFPDIPTRDLVEGLRSAHLRGRLEVLYTGEGRPVVIDGAHTPVSVARAAEGFLTMYPAGGVLLFGSVMGKMTEKMATTLAPHFPTVVVSTPNSFKESDPRAIWEAFRPLVERCILEPDPCRALQAASANASEGQAVFCTGSFYMISEIRACSELSTSPA